MRNLILFGMMGAGKTTVAAVVGERLDRPVIDTDLEIERRDGRTVADIFAHDGEAAFRELEHALIAEVSRREQQVIAVGGGAVLDARNVSALRATGMLVWLRAPADVLARRLADEQALGTRPLLADGGLDDLLEAREPRYREVADHVVEADAAPDVVADRVLAWAGRVPDVLEPDERRRLHA